MASGRASEAYRLAGERDKQNGEKDAELGLIRATLAARVGAVAQATQCASRPTDDSDVQRRQLVFRARQLIRRGEQRQGVELLRAFAEQRPQVYDVWVDLADACAAIGKTAEARSNYERAIRLSSERLEAHLGLARLASRQERLHASQRIYRQIVDENPEALEGWLGLLRVAQLLGDTEQAEQVITSLDKLAPRSAIVHEEKLRLALHQPRRARFATGLETYLRDQPADLNARLWQQRWLYAQGRSVDRRVLLSLLDPLDSERSGLALRVLRSHSSDSMPALLAQVPAAPAPDLQSLAETEARQQIKSRYDPLAGNPYTGHLALRDSGQFGTSIGYEHSFLHDTTGSGTRLPDWQETSFSAYWRQPYAQTFSFDYRWDERFDEFASQTLFGWDRRWSMNWSTRLNAGAALSGNFLPDWRVGGGASYRFYDNAFGHIDVNYLSFTGVSVWQWIPGLTWRWHPCFTTDVRVYLSRDELSAGASRLATTFLASTTWEFNDGCWWKIHYSIGDENSANLFRDQIGQDRFQSTGTALRLGLGERWAIEPSYRFEVHNRYNLHSVGISLLCRF
jgi:YaiO family outer membrane protein